MQVIIQVFFFFKKTGHLIFRIHDDYTQDAIRIATLRVLDPSRMGASGRL